MTDHFITLFREPGFVVRRANESDAPLLATMINHAFKYQDAAKGDVRIDEPGIIEKMASSQFYIFEALDHKSVACVYLKLLTVTVYFGLLSVDDEYRGTGLAPAIINAIEQYAVDLHMRQLRLDYMSLSPWLKTYYERYGYSETGIVRDIGWAKLIRMQKRIAE